MKVAICGYSGLIGQAVTDMFGAHGHQVIAITRRDLAQGVEYLRQMLSSTDVVINLAGAPILTRWTKRGKKQIYDSRILTTHLLTETVNSMVLPPSVFISASAVGIYNNLDVHDEFSLNYADDFLSEVCQAWETEALKLKSDKSRLVILRFGVVLSCKGGALKQMLLPFRLGLGGRIGSGKQDFPWVHINDVTAAIYWVTQNTIAKGIYNLTAPGLVSNEVYTKALANTISRPAFFPIPTWALKMVFGEASDVLVSGQHVVPQRLLADGFTFSFPLIQDALGDLLKRR